MPNRTSIQKAARALAALVVTITIGACSGSPHEPNITLTFIRHAESEANAANIIDTDGPGQGLTEDGKAQAEQLAHQLSRNNFDGVYASDMVRAQETAAPLAQALGKHVEILPGLREINAGWYNNTTSKRPSCVHEPVPADSNKDQWVDAKCTPYLLAPADWLNGDLQDAVPGSINGKQFNDHFSAAVQKIYASGNKRPVAFSHAEAIMYWTLLNVKNPKDSLVNSHPLPNLGRVVISGNPTTGWTLVDWDGIRDFSY